MDQEVTQGFGILKNEHFKHVDLRVNGGKKSLLQLVSNNTQNACMTAKALKQIPLPKPSSYVRHKNQVEGEGKKERLDVYISSEMKDQIRQMARKSHRSMSLYMNDVIRPILEKAIEEEARKASK